MLKEKDLQPVGHEGNLKGWYLIMAKASNLPLAWSTL